MNDVMNAQYKLDVKKQVYDNYNRNLTEDENKKLKQINKDRAKICNIIYNIYEKLFDHAKYKKYTNNLFQLHIK